MGTPVLKTTNPFVTENKAFCQTLNKEFCILRGMETYTERLIWAMENHDPPVSQSELARAIGVKPQAIQYLCDPEKHAQGSKFTSKIADYLGVYAAWLQDGKGSRKKAIEKGRAEESEQGMSGLAGVQTWEHEDDLPPGEYAFIPRLRVQLSAGNGSEQIEVDFIKDQPQAFRADWIRKNRLKPAKLAVMKVSGDSMESRIHDGDAVVVDTSQTDVLDGTVYALWYDGGERVKRLYRRPGGGLIVHSDNDAKYPQMTLTAAEAEHVRILGRVVHVAGEGGL